MLITWSNPLLVRPSITYDMDLITHAALGAVLGELLMGKQAGSKGLIWGVIVGVLPDVDSLLRWTHSDLTYLLYRQSLTHSLLFVLLSSLLFGSLLYRLYGRSQGRRRDWFKLWFWVLLTHTLLDTCAGWGTQLFYPFWQHRFAASVISEIDPLFSLPLLTGLIVGLNQERQSRTRSLWVGMGLLVSVLYLLVTITNKQYVQAVFEHNFERQHASEVIRFETYPTLGNNLLWYGIAEMPYGYQVGYFSVFEGAATKLSLDHIPKRHQLSEELIGFNEVQQLRAVSNRYYVVEAQGDSVLWHDLRFSVGSIRHPAWTPLAWRYSYQLIPSEVDGQPRVRIVDSKGEFSTEALRLTWNRIVGE